MTSKRNFSIINSLMVVILIATLLLIYPSMCVKAERSDVDSVVTLETGLSGVSSICLQANNKVGQTILVYTGNDGLLSFSNKLYKEMETEDKREFMKTALEATKESSLGSQMQNKVYNFIAEQDDATTAAVKYLQSDTSADFVSAKAVIRPFSGPISTFMGVLCLLIFLFLGLSLLFDIAFIVLPGFRLIVERGEENKKPFGVSREAYSTVYEIEKDMSYKSEMVAYIKRRIPVIIIISICLGYLISGKIYDLIVFFIDAFSGV